MDRLFSGAELKSFFGQAVETAMRRRMGLSEHAILDYLADLLAQFALSDNLYRIRAMDGRRLTEVAHMLVEGDVRLNATSFAREREVHRHIGDFTLFWTGLFPESVPRLKSGTQDLLIDYVRQGKESYYIVSTFELGRYRDEAPLFKQLSDQFETFVEGLHLVRQQWDDYAKNA
jgi:hypothetical protein